LAVIGVVDMPRAVAFWTAALNLVGPRTRCAVTGFLGNVRPDQG